MTALLALILALPVSPDTTHGWRAGLTYGREHFTRDRSAWQTVTAAASRKAGLHTFGVELGSVRRFDQSDTQLSGEAYLRLAPRTSLHVRGSAAPDADVIARSDLSTELSQGIRGGWEVSAGYRRMSFPLDAVDILTASVAAYRGAWYLRGRGVAVPTAGTVGFAGALLARRYLGRADRFAELQGGAGQEVVLLGIGPTVELRTTGFAAARSELRLTRRWGVSGGLSWNSDEGLPSRFGISVGLFTVW